MKAAISRIERALTRLEQAEIPLEADDVGTSGDARRRAAEALQSLDTLITELKASRG